MGFYSCQNETNMLRFVGAGFCDFLYTTRNSADTVPRRSHYSLNTDERRQRLEGIWRMTRLRILSPQIVKVLCCKVYTRNGSEAGAHTLLHAGSARRSLLRIFFCLIILAFSLCRYGHSLLKSWPGGLAHGDQGARCDGSNRFPAPHRG